MTSYCRGTPYNSAIHTVFCPTCDHIEKMRGPVEVEWVDVKDRLPEEGKRVLIYKSWEDEIEVDLLYLCPTPVWGCQLHDDQFKVTHWAELPNKPKRPERVGQSDG